MITSAIQRKPVADLLSIGTASGVVFAILFPSWPITGMMASGGMIWAQMKKRQMPTSETDVLRVFAGWFLAVVLCNLLLNWNSFQAGLIAGWHAAP